jgi:hypothetical protein
LLGVVSGDEPAVIAILSGASTIADKPPEGTME